ncbi:PREDICTED: probable dolichyl pyrophosphate Glc1Man9GlcNAc2 alpha-1,3-glucosyltransferase [Dufourea novaeangliae]|uniref:probable dolichyl pyrophosphate Glc1Man9GlcNAc2 alpha-1,3-glucosyltransferase n=1 Tax=Dufourea novaeangliae TaxID=178035 RepID=UPI00076790B9|nr:PREDICTED: probable dolichyl pyrophosphate Glc1Man9GlcNAc2 alpha-1,3-glucosyltransferase [Dufourea novaeangliae]
MNIADRRNAAKSKKTKKSDTATAEWSANKILLRVFVLVTCLKVLLIPVYRSTDFEVHRNWLAITHSLPIQEWYVHAKYQWTLDYPPLFAWFEYFLSHAAKLIDPEMLKVDSQNYASSGTIFFQRGSVIFMDLLFAYGVREIGKVFCTSFDSYAVFVILSLCNMGLLVVDHIHFQYNGFLLGILLLAIANISILQGTLWFALLLNLKHIYLYVAPAFVIWLLKSYCINSGHFFNRLIMLTGIVFTTLVISFGPFVSQLPQVLSRLFPFKRGLVHAYWAANAWALYIGLDKGASMILKRLGWIEITKSAVMTGGLVQEQNLTVLPTPTPFVTIVFTLISILPALYSLFVEKTCDKNPKQFVRCLVLCALSSFMFGWHVHEKAILTAIIPLCVLAVTNKDDARIFLILSSAGHSALLPLLHPNNLTPLKILMLLTYMVACFLALSRKFKQRLLYYHEHLYVVTLPLLTIYETMLHKLIFNDRLPFLPLAVTSIYCAIGVTYCWLLYYYMFLRCNDSIIDQRKKKE